MKRYILPSILILTLTASAADKTTTYTDQTRKLTGDIFDTTHDGKKVTDQIEKEYDDYMDVVIWNDVLKMSINKIKLQQSSPIAGDNIIIDNPATRLRVAFEKEIKRLEKQRLASLDANKTIPSIFAGGYCRLHDTLKISKSYEFARLDCQMNVGNGNYRNIEVFATFYPDYKREMVIALPVYATFENQNRASFNGVVMKDNKTSFNLASWVDNKRIAKMLGEGLLATNDIAHNYIAGYMQARAAARTETEVNYISTTAEDGTTRSLPVITEKVAPPSLEEYVIGGAVELFTKLISIYGKDYLYSQDPLFIVYPQRVYVEGVLSFDNEGLAKKFGRISADQEKRSSDNNKAWQDEKMKIIRNYDKTNKSIIKGVTQ